MFDVHPVNVSMVDGVCDRTGCLPEEQLHLVVKYIRVILVLPVRVTQLQFVIPICEGAHLDNQGHGETLYESTVSA